MAPPSTRPAAPRPGSARRPARRRALRRLEAAPGAGRLLAAPAETAAAGRAHRRRRPKARREFWDELHARARRHHRAGGHALHGRGRALRRDRLHRLRRAARQRAGGTRCLPQPASSPAAATWKRPSCASSARRTTITRRRHDELVLGAHRGHLHQGVAADAARPRRPSRWRSASPSCSWCCSATPSIPIPKGLPTAIVAPVASDMSRSLAAGAAEQRLLPPRRHRPRRARGRRAAAAWRAAVRGADPRRLRAPRAARRAACHPGHRRRHRPSAGGNAIAALERIAAEALGRDLGRVPGVAAAAAPPFELVVHRRYNPRACRATTSCPGWWAPSSP